jgi:hypothetical protein
MTGAESATAFAGATTMDLGTVTGTSWSEVTISWDDGEASSVSHNDILRVQRVPVKIILMACGCG